MALAARPRRLPAPLVRDPLRSRRRPGEDVPVGRGDDLSIISIVRACMKESDEARQTRLKRNKTNVDAYMGIQDFSYKIEGQSTEFLPKVSMAAEQLSAFVKRALTQFGKWFSFKHGKHIKGMIPLNEKHIEAIVMHFLDNLPKGEGAESTSFSVVFGDAIKTAGLESLMVFKVYGAQHTERAFHVEMGSTFELTDRGDGTFEVPDGLPLGGLKPELVVSDRERWRLHVDLIKLEDYYPDPSGAGVYEIHKCERDLAYLQEMADKGVYDKAAVSALKISMERSEDERRHPSSVGHDRAQPPHFRKKVVIEEFWGDLIGSDGRIVRKNCVCTIANEKFLIRKPVDNPNWHGERPFVSSPLIRVPFSVWHKALFDGASSLNFTLNEIFNLVLDGGLASVWGIKQLRAGYLEKPEQVSGGIPQGKTLIVKDDLPANAKVLEEVTTGKVPQEAGAVLQMVEREFLSAALSNELKAGSFPGRRVLATEIQEISQGQALVLDSIAGDIENECIAKILRKAWLTILQNMDMIDEFELEAKIGQRATMWLAETSPEDRFSLLARNGAFNVFGLTAVLAKARDFQKLAALMQLSMGNPIMLQAFIRRFSGEKMLVAAMKMLNLNPDDLEKDEEELAMVEQEMQMALAMGGGQPQKGMAAQPTGDASLPAEINQAGNPISGLSAS